VKGMKLGDVCPLFFQRYQYDTNNGCMESSIIVSQDLRQLRDRWQRLSPVTFECVVPLRSFALWSDSQRGYSTADYIEKGSSDCIAVRPRLWKGDAECRKGCDAGDLDRWRTFPDIAPQGESSVSLSGVYHELRSVYQFQLLPGELRKEGDDHVDTRDPDPFALKKGARSPFRLDNLVLKGNFEIVAMTREESHPDAQFSSAHKKTCA
jgi:hypothetical protein